jgi:hypothetical protein
MMQPFARTQLTMPWTVPLHTLRLSGHGVDAYLYTRGSRLRAFSLGCAYGQLLQSCAPLQVSQDKHVKISTS